MLEEIITVVVANTGEHSHEQIGRMKEERKCSI
jgi:hypothetical protein